jgi:peroxiredoxin
MTEAKIYKVKKENKELITVDPKVFDEMKTEQGVTISEINEKGGKVLLYFLRALGCAYCMGALEDLYNLYPELLKMNTYIVIVYKEKKKVFDEYMKNERTQRYLYHFFYEKKIFSILFNTIQNDI